MKVKSTVREREQLIRGALVQLLGLQLRAGTAPAELEEFARDCANDARQTVGAVPQDVQIMFDAQDYGSVLRMWHLGPTYLSKDGYPRPLSMNGKFGLRRLIERYYPGDHHQHVLLTLRKAGLIRRQRNGKWLPTKKFAVFPRLNEALLTHVAEGVSKLVQTVTQNVTSQSDDVLFERSAKVRTFPVTAAPAFREFVNAQASVFLSTVDDWLESRSNSSGTSGRKTCTAGVFAFAFLDDARQITDVATRFKGKKTIRQRLRSARQLIPQRSP